MNWARRALGGRRAKKAFWLALFLFCLLIRYLPTGYVKVSPGPVRSLERVVTVEGVSPGIRPVSMVTVTAEKARLYDLIASFFDGSVTVVRKDSLFGGRTEEQYERDNAALMQESIRVATELALTEAGYVWNVGGPLPIEVSVAPGDVIGPSAGLAFALEIYLRLRASDLLPDCPRDAVVATGVLSPCGDVGPVGGVYQKILAAESSGVGVFILPRANLAEALENARTVEVKGVSSFREAVSFLLARQ